MRPSILVRVAIVAVLAAGTLAPRPVAAQVTPADSAAVLLAAADDFDRRGEQDVAEALYRHIADRFPDTDAAATARARLGEVTVEQSRAGGETELKVWSTVYGTWLGIAVPGAAGADESEPYGVGLLLGAPAGFFGGRAFAQSRPVSLGQARAITWGGTWGMIQGLGWANALDFGGGERIIEGDIEIDEEASAEAILASMIVGSALGIGGGMLAARREISPGTATTANLGSLWGLWFGAAGSILFDLDEDPTWGTMMLTGNAGLVGGALAGSRWPLSRSRSRLISIAGLIGGVAGGGIILIAQPDADETAIAIPLTTSIAGLVLGAALTSGHDAEEDAATDVQAAGHFAPSGALLSRSQGAWSLSAPLPLPVREPALRPDGRDALRWKVPLLNVRF